MTYLFLLEDGYKNLFVMFGRGFCLKLELFFHTKVQDILSLCQVVSQTDALGTSLLYEPKER